MCEKPCCQSAVAAEWVASHYAFIYAAHVFCYNILIFSKCVCKHGLLDPGAERVQQRCQLDHILNAQIKD